MLLLLVTSSELLLVSVKCCYYLLVAANCCNCGKIYFLLHLLRVITVDVKNNNNKRSLFCIYCEVIFGAANLSTFLSSTASCYCSCGKRSSLPAIHLLWGCFGFLLLLFLSLVWRRSNLPRFLTCAIIWSFKNECHIFALLWIAVVIVEKLLLYVFDWRLLFTHVVKPIFPSI